MPSDIDNLLKRKKAERAVMVEARSDASPKKRRKWSIKIDMIEAEIAGLENAKQAIKPLGLIRQALAN